MRIFIRSMHLSFAFAVLFTLHGSNECLVADAPPNMWSPADLGDRVWLEWRAEDLADGAVSSWTSRVGKVEAKPPAAEQQPLKQNGEVLFTGGQCLNFPRQSNARVAHRA